MQGIKCILLKCDKKNILITCVNVVCHKKYIIRASRTIKDIVQCHIFFLLDSW
jgi:hypothetical protein